jgi:Ca-activated chloride channel homolog
MWIRHLAVTLGLILFAGGPLSAQGIADVFIHDQGRRLRPGPRHPGISIDKHLVDVRIEAGAATTEVTQVFRNPSRMILEGVYLFPVPENASLTAFSMEMNGKLVEGEVLERKKARQIYESIVRQTRDPGLLEYAGKRLYRARVFPVPAGKTVEVKLRYVEKLERDGGVFEYSYPLKTQTFSKSRVGQVAVNLRIADRNRPRSVFSSSHEIEIGGGDDGPLVASFEGKGVLATRDFHLYFSPGEEGLGFALLSDRPDPEENGFFMMNLAPTEEVSDAEVLPKDVIFVVDTSGSMAEGAKMDQARKALIHGIKRLNARDRFNLVGFSTEARAMASELREVNEGNIAAAAAWVTKLKAAGGTNIHDALQQGLAKFGDDDRVKILVFLTDGLPTVGDTNPKRILAATAKANAGRARIFSYGVGYDVNTTLLDAMGDENGGVSDYVTPAQNIELVLGRFYDKIAYPVMSDLELRVDGVDLLEVYPKRLPDLFRGGEITVFGRYSGDGAHAVRLKGKIGGREKEYVFEGHFAAKPTQRDFLSVLWAKRKVGYLWEAIQKNGFQKELHQEIVRLGKTYAIATPYTSMLVLEDEDRGRLRRDRHWGGGPGGGVRPDPRQAGAGTSGGAAPPGAPVPGGGGGGRRGLTTSSNDAIGLGGGAASGVRTKPSRTQGVGAVRSALERKRMKEAGLKDRKVDLFLGEEDLRDEEASDADLGEKPGAAPRKKSPQRRLVRFEGRTFLRRGEVWIESRYEKLDDAALAKKAESVLAFSKRYFELLSAHPELGKILARFPEVTLEVQGRTIRFAKAEAKGADAKPATPAPEVPKKD